MADADGNQYKQLPGAGLAGDEDCNTEDFEDRNTPIAINLPMSKEDDAVLGISIFWRDEDNNERGVRSGTYSGYPRGIDEGTLK